MKRICLFLSFILCLSFIFVMPVNSEESTSQFTKQECEEFLAAALEVDERLIYDQPTNGLYAMFRENQCNDDSTVCILKEEIDSCGMISQYVDNNSDHVADAKFVWQPVKVRTDSSEHIVFVIHNVEMLNE